MEYIRENRVTWTQNEGFSSSKVVPIQNRSLWEINIARPQELKKEVDLGLKLCHSNVWFSLVKVTFIENELFQRYLPMDHFTFLKSAKIPKELGHFGGKK